jgi:hypothetical protein
LLLSALMATTSVHFSLSTATLHAFAFVSFCATKTPLAL